MGKEHYVNAEAYAMFEDFDGQEIECSILLPIPVTQAYDLFLDECWLDRSANSMIPGISLVHSGEGPKRGYLHSQRRRLTTTATAIIEMVTQVGLPSRTKSDKIPSFSYERIAGLFPVLEYVGFVRFIPDRSSKASTLVVWNVKFRPTWFGNVFCCGGTILRASERHYMNTMLAKLKTAAAKRKTHSLY